MSDDYVTSYRVPESDDDDTEQVTLDGSEIEEDRPVSSEWI